MVSGGSDRAVHARRADSRRQHDGCLGGDEARARVRVRSHTALQGAGDARDHSLCTLSAPERRTRRRRHASRARAYTTVRAACRCAKAILSSWNILPGVLPALPLVQAPTSMRCAPGAARRGADLTTRYLLGSKELGRIAELHALARELGLDARQRHSRRDCARASRPGSTLATT